MDDPPFPVQECGGEGKSEPVPGRSSSSVSDHDVVCLYVKKCMKEEILFQLAVRDCDCLNVMCTSHELVFT